MFYLTMYLKQFYLQLYLIRYIVKDLRDNKAISHSSQCSTTGVTKAVVCAVLSVEWCI